MMNDVNYKKLSIVIPVFNKWNFTKSCLNDLLQLPMDHEIIIIDNASTDETHDELNKIHDELFSGISDRISKNLTFSLTLIHNEENVGFAKACNQGCRAAMGDNILFLNNDIRVKSNYNDWTQPLINMCPYALVGPTMGQLDNNLNFVQEANRPLIGKSYMSGWCLASSRDNFRKLDLTGTGQIFSEEFGLAYFEDTDLSFRARKLGIKMEVVDIPVVHFGKQTSKQLNTHQLYTNARQIFVKKWLNK